MSRILVHFSCGAASAVAAKIAVTAYPDRAEVIYCDLSADEHPDNARFLGDVERWIDRKVIVLRHPKYRTVEEAWRGERYIVGVFGAACTRVLKREVGDRYARPDDVHVFGYTADERGRIADIEAFSPKLRFLWVLAGAGITKQECYSILTANGIALPAMYRLGYGHNNCIGCCKAGKGYWNKVRKDFPEVFASRAAVQRELGVGFRSGGGLFFLDELRPDEGRMGDEPPIECGLMCQHHEQLIDLAAQMAKKEGR